MGNEFLSIFPSNNFFQESKNFREKWGKCFLGGMSIFEGTERQKAKMNITFLVGNEIPNTVFKFFPPKKKHTG